RHRVYLSEDLRGGDDRILATPARRRAGAADPGAADRHCRRGVEAGRQVKREGKAVTILLQTVDLRKQFGETKACDGVNFVVQKGEFLSLVGSNGAGKTSLVNLISAHLTPDSGQILFEGKDITFLTVSERI